MKFLSVPEKIIFYKDFKDSHFRLEPIVDYIKRNILWADILVRPSLIESYIESQGLDKREELYLRIAERFAKIRVKDPFKRCLSVSVLPMEVDYERRRIHSPHLHGVVYQGEGYQEILREMIPQQELDLRYLHIFFTKQLIATWGGGRYHLRVALYGFPNIISLSGPQKALAKEKSLHMVKNLLLSVNPSIDTGVVEFSAGADIIKDRDPRIPELMKGYCLQALFYQLTGDPFCRDRNCRLYNAHLQQEALQAQSEALYDLCPYHRSVIEGIAREFN